MLTRGEFPCRVDCCVCALRLIAKFRHGMTIVISEVVFPNSSTSQSILTWNGGGDDENIEREKNRARASTRERERQEKWERRKDFDEKWSSYARVVEHAKAIRQDSATSVSLSLSCSRLVSLVDWHLVSEITVYASPCRSFSSFFILISSLFICR